jgi:hypothetical protein
VVPPEAPEPISFADEPTSVDEFPDQPEELPEPLSEEEMVASDTPREDELPSPAFVEPLMPDDPAKTIDFSRSGGADGAGDLGGGFEDEVSTGVYDVEDESVIDFDELKKLDEPAEAPEPLRAEEAPIVDEPSPEEETPVGEDLPADDLPEIELVDTVAGEALPEVPDEAPAAFDLESTDAGLKTQELSQIGEDDPMGAFDFDAPPPDMDAVPEFELDVAQPEPDSDFDFEPELEPASEVEPAYEIEAEAPEERIDVEAFTPTVEEEVEQVADEPDVDRVAETVLPQSPPPKGDYVDRIEAPGPFAPDAEAPREAPEVFEALRATAKAEPREQVPDVPSIGPAFQLPPDEAGEDLLSEQPELEIAEGVANDAVAEFGEKAWEEPVDGQVVTEGAVDGFGDEFAADEPEQAAELDVAEEPWGEPVAEETSAEEPVTGFSAKAGGEPTPEQLLAEVMGVEPVATNDEDLPEELTEKEAATEAAEEGPSFEAESWGEQTEDQIVAEAPTVEEPFEEFSAVEPEESPDISQEEEEAPPIEEQPDGVEAQSAGEAEGEFEAAAGSVDEGFFEAASQEPVVVGNEDPWTEEELSDVYRISEVEKAEQAAAIEAATPRAVDVQAEDNQLHLRLQGTGAIVESGQVRALDIEVPVPGSWVGNKRVTLQLRLTLTPDLEDEDDGPGSPS